MNLNFPTVTHELLKRTTSRCPKCHAICPAEVLKTDSEPAQIFLKRTCPTHGEISICISSDARFYWLSQGKPENANGCCAGGNCKTDSQFSTFNTQLPTLALSASDGKV
ncbi:MAG: radical SAM protein, partial [Verrucomicrobiota bacterium]|nr:radical SAM protein [Verrucomicrobiota bacterium]